TEWQAQSCQPAMTARPGRLRPAGLRVDCSVHVATDHPRLLLARVYDATHAADVRPATLRRHVPAADRCRCVHAREQPWPTRLAMDRRGVLDHLDGRGSRGEPGVLFTGTVPARDGGPGLR